MSLNRLKSFLEKQNIKVATVGPGKIATRIESCDYRIQYPVVFEANPLNGEKIEGAVCFSASWAPPDHLAALCRDFQEYCGTLASLRFYPEVRRVRIMSAVCSREPESAIGILISTCDSLLPVWLHVDGGGSWDGDLLDFAWTMCQGEA